MKTPYERQMQASNTKWFYGKFYYGHELLQEYIQENRQTPFIGSSHKEETTQLM